MVKFGDVVIAAGGIYSSKPRPVVVVQNDYFSTGSSIVIAPLTRTLNQEIPYRIEVTPSPENGLRTTCFVEVEKLTAIRVSSVSKVIGRLSNGEMQNVQQMMHQLLSPGQHDPRPRPQNPFSPSQSSLSESALAMLAEESR